jgi:MYXO-CTERM domain-containing protein
MRSFFFFFAALYATQLEAKPTHRCATPLYWQQSVQKPTANLPRIAVTEKTLHTPFGNFPHTTTSENFAFQAGGANPDADNVEQILAALERSFTHEITQMGHPLPVGAEQFFVNVYLGNSAGAPTIDGFAYAYVTLDDDGIPYIVIHPDLLEEYNTNNFGFADTTLAHEFYHAIQFGTGAFEELNGYWFWEATADWISVEVFPEYIDGDAFVPGYLMRPHVSIELIDFSDDLASLHHYGAQIFARFLSEKVADADLIRDAWIQGLSDESPMDVVARLLGERGQNFNDAFTSFAAHNAVLDYERADSYNAWLDSYIPFYPGEDFRVVGDLSVANEDGSMRISNETFPSKYAYNVLDISGVPQGEVAILFSGEPTGSSRSDSSFGLMVVKTLGDEVTYFPIEVQDHKADATLNIGEYDELFLVVSSQPGGALDTETFRYNARAFGVPSFQGGSCSVSSSGAGSLWLFLTMFALLFSRRKSR